MTCHSEHLAPNILLVFADQMRGQAMSCAEPHHNGPETNVYTPHFDAMAAGRVRFTNACSTDPACVPCRAIRTSRYSFAAHAPGGLAWHLPWTRKT